MRPRSANVSAFVMSLSWEHCCKIRKQLRPRASERQSHLHQVAGSPWNAARLALEPANENPWQTAPTCCFESWEWGYDGQDAEMFGRYMLSREVCNTEHMRHTGQFLPNFKLLQMGPFFLAGARLMMGAASGWGKVPLKFSLSCSIPFQGISFPSTTSRKLACSLLRLYREERKHWVKFHSLISPADFST